MGECVRIVCTYIKNALGSVDIRENAARISPPKRFTWTIRSLARGSVGADQRFASRQIRRCGPHGQSSAFYRGRDVVLVAPGPLGAPCRYGMADDQATIIRAHEHAACAKGQKTQASGHCRGGFTTKLHALCECVVQSAPVHREGGRTGMTVHKPRRCWMGSMPTPRLPTRGMKRTCWPRDSTDRGHGGDPNESEPDGPPRLRQDSALLQSFVARG